MSGCASKELTPEEMKDGHFTLPSSYTETVSKEVIASLQSKSNGKGFNYIYEKPIVNHPDEECFRSWFTDGVNCIYSGEASILYDVPALRKYGQIPSRLFYKYTVHKSGTISVSQKSL